MEAIDAGVNPSARKNRVQHVSENRALKPLVTNQKTPCLAHVARQL
jgi:hypothetical protein